MSNYYLPLKAPTPLPATGVTAVTFKVWKNTLIAHLEQDANHHHFMPGGKYSTWIAKDVSKRIAQLHDEDPDKQSLDEKRDAVPPTLTARQYTDKIVEFLNKRNAQLSKFVIHTATLCYYTEHDDISMQSTSLEWIFNYLITHYGLESKGANFLNIAQHVYKKGEPVQTFYKQYRASYIDNLRKSGDLVKYKNNAALTKDEQLSPSFENSIVLWSLDKIDPRLPAKVKKNYGHQMTANTTLKDLQPVIFQNISSMLEELDDANGTRALSSLSLEEDMSLNAFNVRNNFRGRGNRGAKPFQSYRGSRGPARGQPRSGQPRSGRAPASGEKFCRICSLAGSDDRVYTSHEIGQCSRLTIRDMESLRDALVLNGMITEECVVAASQTEQPDYFLQPGWDDVEASQHTDGLSE